VFELLSMLRKVRANRRVELDDVRHDVVAHGLPSPEKGRREYWEGANWNIRQVRAAIFAKRPFTHPSSRFRGRESALRRLIHANCGPC
jgi:hypothetical protein